MALEKLDPDKTYIAVGPFFKYKTDYRWMAIYHPASAKYVIHEWDERGVRAKVLEVTPTDRRIYDKWYEDIINRPLDMAARMIRCKRVGMRWVEKGEHPDAPR